ncbi:hydroxyisourate hydrolase [Actinomadura rupiterrae]|uniref:hydroxyisourate hydrolase n=1 Tax=Actinomadura rupiterrae TaxID=559627 RepID=UPI0020A46A04|nr:hydroxyisourate hydrolase [Actinomadura rupiterrae]MCP2339993.1 5-hydroxyisourate hydrolase [Actinomadura rupiterrae]
MSLSTHVLDAARGRPAEDVRVRLERRDGAGYREIAAARTDADGRIRDWGGADLAAGTYRLVFDTAELSDFYPEVAVAFRIADPGQHYHVPLLLSPFAYSTYRGS